MQLMTMAPQYLDEFNRQNAAFDALASEQQAWLVAQRRAAQAAPVMKASAPARSTAPWAPRKAASRSSVDDQEKSVLAKDADRCGAADVAKKIRAAKSISEARKVYSAFARGRQAAKRSEARSKLVNTRSAAASPNLSGRLARLEAAAAVERARAGEQARAERARAEQRDKLDYQMRTGRYSPDAPRGVRVEGVVQQFGAVLGPDPELDTSVSR